MRALPASAHNDKTIKTASWKSSWRAQRAGLSRS